MLKKKLKFLVRGVKVRPRIGFCTDEMESRHQEMHVFEAEDEKNAHRKARVSWPDLRKVEICPLGEPIARFNGEPE